MTRPLAGLLATTAAIPGVWFLSSGDSAGEPPRPIEPESGSLIQTKPDPARQLALTEPNFAPTMVTAAVAHATEAPAVPAAPQPAAAPQPVEVALAALPEAELGPPPEASQDPAPAPGAAAPLAVASGPEMQAAVVQQAPAEPAPSIITIAQTVSAPAPAPAPVVMTPAANAIQFSAQPVIQQLPSPPLASAPPPPIVGEPVRRISPPVSAAKTDAPRSPAAEPPSTVHRRAKLPQGEVIRAAFSPASEAAATHRPVPSTKLVVEPTTARTVPIGAPGTVTYPEPSFGPAEAKFIPAAYSSAEPPEQPAGLGQARTLAQAIAYSYETNPRLLAERASTRAADLGYPAARAAFGPRLDASASLSYTRDRDEILPGSFLRQQGWSDTASLILSQPLLTFGRSQARVGQAAANIDFRRESLKLVQNEVMIDVIAAYVGTLREAGAVTIARENVALLQRQLEESNARFAVREITLADVQQVETRLALGKTGLLEAQARLGEIQSRFYRSVGMPPGELAPPEPLELPVSNLTDAYALADGDSPLIRAAQARERVSRSLLAATRAEIAPRVDFRGSADYGAMSDFSRELRGTRVRGAVTLSVPLFDSGARAAESGQAREANLADLQLVAAAQRDSRTEVATGWNNLLAARMSIDHYRQAVESAQRGYENAQRQERAGMRTTLDVLDLARDLLNVRNAYNAALASEYLARASLLAALGRLDPAAIAGGLKLYDPADHFRKVRGKGDFPLLTGTLSALDGVTLPNLKADRPAPDAAQMVGTGETVTGE